MKHTRRGRTLAALLALALCLGLLPTAAWAAEEGVPYIYYTWNNGLERHSGTVTATAVTASDTEWNSSTTGGWYVAQGEVTISSLSSRVTVNGDVHLILADNCTLTVNGGINVAESNSLTIYGQTQGTGTLVAQNCTPGCAGIGGGHQEDGGTVTIYGGTVTAAGGNGGAGIGGGGVTLPGPSATGGAGGTVTIYGGTVKATGGIGGAGIGGGGSVGPGGGSGGAGGTIAIYGGTVTATGGNGGAGIGGGLSGGPGGGSGGAGGTITISGGTVTATGGIGGAGIGGGLSGGLGTFSTGKNGHAVIFAQGGEGAAAISDDGGQGNWQGVIFQGTAGQVYGTSITPTEDFTIGKNQTLTIGENQTLTIPVGVTLTNEGKITNNGTIIVYGTLNNKGTVNGSNPVTYKVTGVSLSPETLTLEAGGTATLTATVLPEGATNKSVTWSSNAPSVATVDENGVVTAVGNGTATITATAADGSGEKASCTVTVTHVHTTTKTEARPATCTEAGNTEYWYCSGCHKYFADEAGTEETTLADTVIPATGHTFRGGWCAVCGARDPNYVPPNPSYLISVSQAEGGTITTYPAAAKQGDTVTLTVTPEDGYELADLTVTDFWGREVALTEQADGTYTFTMPASQVEIEAAFTQAQLPFTDVSEADWFYDEVQYVVDKGLMIGVSDTQFAPGADLTRAMMWTILARMDGETITGANWAQDARAWAMESGVSDGTDANRAVTREELVTMLWRYTGQPQGAGDLSGFADADTVSSWAEEAMSWSVGAGLIQGDENGLTPTATAIRAQIAAILMRFCEGVAG